MNHRLQLSPLSTSTKLHTGLTFAGRWGRPLANLEDVKFFRSWLVYDSDLEVNRSSGRLNWNMLAGLTAMVAISFGGWSGIALLVRHFMK
jgi:hypothetical protein